MKSSGIFVLAAFAISFMPSAYAETPNPYAAPRAIIDKAIETGQVQSIAVAVFRNGHIDWEEGFGLADREAGIKATAHTSYSIASISKPFTATALMTLVESGRINLDRPANDFLGAAKIQAMIGSAEDATVRRLANHTAGLPVMAEFFYDGVTPPSDDEAIEHVGKIVSRPGERYAYSNVGYGILGNIIAKQSGMSFAEYLRSRVFVPLNMRDSSLGPPIASGVRVAARYTSSGSRLPYYVTDHPGASEVYSSAHDLAKFAAFHMKVRLPEQNAILNDDSLDQMHRATTPPGNSVGYAIGFAVNDGAGNHVIWHNGGMPGASSIMLLDPENGVAIVVLANTRNNSLVDRIADEIAASILPDWKTSLKSTSSPANTSLFPELIGKWSGRIIRPGEHPLPVRLEIATDGSVKASFGDQAPVALKDAGASNGRLSGSLGAPLPTVDARYASNATLDVKREGDRLYGTITALDDQQAPQPNGSVAYWIDMHHTP